MKCPMKFNNPCADADDECEGEKCMWCVRYNDLIGCAVAFTISPYCIMTNNSEFEGMGFNTIKREGE